jgi:type VI protein secretion system component Hcp
LKLRAVVTDHKKMWVVGISAAIVATGIGTAFAATPSGIPSANGTITGCYPNHGTLKRLSLIDAANGATCPNGFTELNFNQTGPKGPAGDTGPQGPAGNSSPSPTANVVGTVTFDFAGGSDTSNIYAFDETANSSTNIGSQAGGAGAGKVTFSGISITKKVDAATVDLFKALTAGTEIPTAEVVLYSPGTTTPLLSYKFRTVVVSSDEIAVDSTSNTPLDKVTFAVAAIAESFGSGSSSSTPISGGENQVTNSAF